jgi:hypothetical protein
MIKQRDLVSRIRRGIGKGPRKMSNASIMESVTNKLIGMSVGRVKLWNADRIVPDLCWVKGFREVTLNSHVKTQAKRLDALRNRLIFGLVRDLRTTRALAGKKRSQGGKNRAIVYYGKPFSYYYHLTVRRIPSTPPE